MTSAELKDDAKIDKLIKMLKFSEYEDDDTIDQYIKQQRLDRLNEKYKNDLNKCHEVVKSKLTWKEPRNDDKFKFNMDLQYYSEFPHSNLRKKEKNPGLKLQEFNLELKKTLMLRSTKFQDIF